MEQHEIWWQVRVFLLLVLSRVYDQTIIYLGFVFRFSCRIIMDFVCAACLLFPSLKDELDRESESYKLSEFLCLWQINYSIAI